MNDSEFRKAKTEDIVLDRTSGASELGRRALGYLAEYAQRCHVEGVNQLRAELEQFAKQLQASRPSMAPLENLIRRWLDRLATVPSDSLAEARLCASEIAHSLCSQSMDATTRAAQNAVRLVEDRAVIITHSFSSTIHHAFGALKNRDIRAIITESRPGLEGKILAAKLSELSIPTIYITDAQLGHFTAQADIALVGADAILGDGSVVNKAGTYLLALAAHDRGIPFYVCCESFKRTTLSCEEIKLEEMDPAELAPPQLPNLTPRNTYFDITPARFVTAWVDETGKRRP